MVALAELELLKPLGLELLPPPQPARKPPAVRANAPPDRVSRNERRSIFGVPADDASGASSRDMSSFMSVSLSSVD